ncbi:helix-turn-helix domain-containing protein [Streptomyces sp. p1417]|uniref:Helix-turn-helix domain-containing protein n=1 Tax=Streptomyces typhae TaxID=2681492 RepID=A0A6L6WU76_9ACTN|nr:helix-turn-helix domain-containing protein [Streptomyces typhae]MVO85058.1 helix-turn-helix domain-containing protein [Streptomyces typhae]
MTDHGWRLRVLDPEREPAAIKALTHPLRITLLGLLRRDGPATASELAAKTGESSASTSYHLRVLAKHAFVAEAEHRDGRERRWRSVHDVTTWDHAAMEASPVGRDFAVTMARRQIEHLGASLAQHEADMAAGRIGPQWREHSGITDLMPRLTPESLGELQQAFEDKLAELRARDAGDDRAEQVTVLLATLPVAERAGGEPEDAGGVPGGPAVLGVSEVSGVSEVPEVPGVPTPPPPSGADSPAGVDRPAPRRVRGHTHD